MCSSERGHAGRALFFDEQPLVYAVRMEVVVAGLEQLDQVAHRDVLLADYAQVGFHRAPTRVAASSRTTTEARLG